MVGAGLAGTKTSSLIRSAVDRAELISEADARCRLVRIGTALFPLFLSEDLVPADGLSAIALFDGLLPDRLEAIARFSKALEQKSPPSTSLTTQRRSRLRQILRVFDARRDGFSYRGIAEVLFPKHRIDAMSWAGNALRETTIRLARDGLKLVAGGYRALLRRSHK